MLARIRLNTKVMVMLGILIIVFATPALAAPSLSAWRPALSLESIPGSSSEVNTAFLDGCPILSRDGLKLYIASDRPGGLGGIDIWVADRSATHEGFGTPVNIGAPINSEYNDFCPSPVRHGKRFLFVSNRPGGCGGSDIYLTRWHPVNGWEENRSGLHHPDYGRFVRRVVKNGQRLWATLPESRFQPDENLRPGQGWPYKPLL